MGGYPWCHMGFYLRKSVNLGGGVRLNLSSGGFGLSAGVKGFRFGMNGRGTYVHMGRGGVYYRQQFAWAKRQNGNRGASNVSHQTDRSCPHDDDLDSSVYFTEALDLPLEVSSGLANVEDVLRHFRPQTGYGWLPACLGAAALLGLLHSPAASAFFLVLFATSLLALPFLRSKEILVYNLDGEAERCFSEFVDQVEAFMNASRLWVYENRSSTTDWKRNAGATNLIRRRAASFGIDNKISSNISIPCLSSGDDRIYFLPDLVVCVSAGNLAAFSYSEFCLKEAIVQFVEQESVPPDAVVVSHTWRFVNKNGGPDRRFKNNRRIPVCAYQELDITLGSSFRRVVSKSRQADVTPLNTALFNLRSRVRVMSALATPAALPAPTIGAWAT
ncbi:DUF4236 domain-containing protein [Hyphomonas sp. NPDC076900]|uniref:DUF4236 domain-containing protein n=1 Tax=unclassified Hyphomonas TaxID=2630699 RepID=UPI003CFCB723